MGILPIPDIFTPWQGQAGWGQAGWGQAGWGQAGCLLPHRIISARQATRNERRLYEQP
ncbi:MAG: hypothetical protein F6K39_08075 [Okeania sp. SIO3B3]|nr:hypothetical protein [Okeania sp. SIO3B3]